MTPWDVLVEARTPMRVIPQTEAELERRRAVHESGHALAAVRLGIPFSFVTIAAENPHIHRLL